MHGTMNIKFTKYDICCRKYVHKGDQQLHTEITFMMW